SPSQGDLPRPGGCPGSRAGRGAVPQAGRRAIWCEREPGPENRTGGLGPPVAAPVNAGGGCSGRNCNVPRPRGGGGAAGFVSQVNLSGDGGQWNDSLTSCSVSTTESPNQLGAWRVKSCCSVSRKEG